MSRLHSNCLPADLGVGCTFAERLRTAAEVALNGGTVHGAPVFSGGGMICDGANDYIVYALDGHEFYSDEISIEQEFWPDFAADEDAMRYFFDGRSAANYYIFRKFNNAGGNDIALHLGNTYIGSVLEAVYSPHWKVNQRNVWQISSDGSNNNIRLNNNLVFTNVKAWSKKNIDSFYIGDSQAGGAKFKGKIGPVKIYQSVLHERDHYNTYYNKAYGFTNDAVLYLPMTAARHEAARTLDVSGNNNHAVFGAGGATPTKGDYRGYCFDGGDWMVVPATGIFNRPEVGILLEFTPEFATDHNGSHFLFDSTNGLRYFVEKRANAAANVLRIYLGNAQIATIPEATYSPYWEEGGRNVLAVSGESGATDVWLNGGLILDADNSAWTAKDPANFYIGCNQGTANRFLGDIHSTMIFPYLLTPRMVADLRHNRINSIGEV